MKILLAFVLAGIAAAAASLPPAAGAATDPEAVVRAYAAAASRNDLDAFLALYAPDIRKYRFPAELTSQGLEHNRSVYAKSFPRHPDLRVEILDLITVGDTVVAHERVSGLPDGSVVDELTAYEVRDGRIVHIVYMERLAREAGR